MAFNVSQLTDYTEKASQMLYDEVLTNDLFSNYTIETGIEYKRYINFLDTDFDFVAGGCDIAVSGETSIYQKEIEVVNFGSHLRYCYKTLAKKAVSDLNYEETLINEIINKSNQKLNTAFWEGNKAGGDLIDGLRTMLIADTNVLKLAKTAPTLTTIITRVNEMINALPNKNQLNSGELTIHTDIDTYLMYREALTLAYSITVNDKETGDNEMWVNAFTNKVKIKGEPGFVSDLSGRMVIIPNKNIVIGLDEVQKVASLDIVNDPITKYVHIMQDFMFGVQYVFDTAIVVMQDV